MSQELKAQLLKRLKSLAWRSLVMFLVGLIALVLDGLNGVEVPLWVVGLVGLLGGELTKFLNSKMDIFGAMKR